jgi:hypothetical protein
MIALDFAPGLHGHFLEYVINHYIFRKPKLENIFQSSGAVDRINVREEYENFKAVHCGHYSSFEYPWDNDTAQIIFIRHNSELDFVLLTNIYHRCHPVAGWLKLDFDVEKIMQYHRDIMLSDAIEEWQLKNNWFTKLNERHFDPTNRYPQTDLPVFEFDFACFFDFVKFVKELQRVSEFVNLNFVYDSSLYDLWEDFLSRNQGYKLYTEANNIVAHACADRPCVIPNDWKLHAYLNYAMSKSFRLCDGVLHSDQPYPTDARELYKIITQHLEEFDNRF